MGKVEEGLTSIKARDFLRGYNIAVNEQEVELSLCNIQMAIDSTNMCKSCNGLDQCKQGEAGSFIIPSAYSGRLYFGVCECALVHAKHEAERTARLLQGAFIPPCFSDATLDNYKRNSDNDKAVKAAEYVVSNGEKGLFLHGNTGTGKTRLAASIVNDKIASGKSAVFITFAELISSIKRSFETGNTNEIMELVKSTPFLVLDDLGAERMTAFVSETLFSLINARMNNELQTIITSNYALDKLAERLAIRGKNGQVEDDIPGKRIVSRIMGMCYIVEIGGNDRRM